MEIPLPRQSVVEYTAVLIEHFAVIGGETIILTAVALLLLAMGRALINRAGSSTASSRS